LIAYGRSVTAYTIPYHTHPYSTYYIYPQATYLPYFSYFRLRLRFVWGGGFVMVVQKESLREEGR